MNDFICFEIWNASEHNYFSYKVIKIESENVSCPVVSSSACFKLRIDSEYVHYIGILRDSLHMVIVLKMLKKQIFIAILHNTPDSLPPNRKSYY